MRLVRIPKAPRLPRDLAIDDAFMASMRSAFSDAEILDLSICCANWVGMGRLNQILGLDTGCAVPHAP